MNFLKDYYAILGSAPNITSTEIKAAYRKLAMRYHPDRNPGKPEAEELIKEINEACEVLGNETNRAVYDAWRTHSATTDENLTNEKSPETGSAEPRKRVFKKKYTVYEDHKVYIKGSITIKFYGEPEHKLSDNILREAHYALSATNVFIHIDSEDIHTIEPTELYSHVYSNEQLFALPLSQPINCGVNGTEGISYYQLHIQGLKIVNPVIFDVTKHDKESFGTLKGDVYGYINHLKAREVEEEFTEQYGETGRVEEKGESTILYSRKEYYYHDGSTYWSPWETKSKKNNGKSDEQQLNNTRYPGCGSIFGLLLLIFLLLKAPLLILSLSLIILVFWILSLLGNLFRNTTSFSRFVARIIVAGLLFFGVFSFMQNGCNRKTYTRPKPTGTTIRSTETQLDPDSNKRENHPDTLITHFMRWKNYDSAQYSIGLSIRLSDLQSSMSMHNNLYVPINHKENIGQVYKLLNSQDDQGLRYVYQAFDSIRTNNHLNRQRFADIMVSCVQNMPFSLVLDGSCSGDYQDEYVSWYLANCTDHCCIGFERYGVRSPLEFLSDLQGDCDTRALLLFSLFSHFGYDAALMTSIPYKHAVIALATDQQLLPGTSIKMILGKPYFLWETTSPGFRCGQISGDMKDLGKWDISLLNIN